MARRHLIHSDVQNVLEGVGERMFLALAVCSNTFPHGAVCCANVVQEVCCLVLITMMALGQVPYMRACHTWGFMLMEHPCLDMRMHTTCEIACLARCRCSKMQRSPSSCGPCAAAPKGLV